MNPAVYRLEHFLEVMIKLFSLTSMYLCVTVCTMYIFLCVDVYTQVQIHRISCLASIEKQNVGNLWVIWFDPAWLFLYFFLFKGRNYFASKYF